MLLAIIKIDKDLKASRARPAPTPKTPGSAAFQVFDNFGLVKLLITDAAGELHHSTLLFKESFRAALQVPIKNPASSVVPFLL